MKRHIIIGFIAIIFLIGCSAPADLSPPNGSTRLINNGDVVYYSVFGYIASMPLEQALRFAHRVKAKKIVIDIHSPGGALNEAIKIIGLLDEYRNAMIIETKVSGFAMSGGFLLSISGDLEHRFVSHHAFLMWHHVVGHDEPFRKWADERIFKYIAKRTNLTVAELEERTTDYEKIEKLDEEIKTHEKEISELKTDPLVTDMKYIKRLYRAIENKKRLKKTAYKNWFITAEEAILLGIADGYILPKEPRRIEIK